MEEGVKACPAQLPYVLAFSSEPHERLLESLAQGNNTNWCLFSKGHFDCHVVTRMGPGEAVSPGHSRDPKTRRLAHAGGEARMWEE